MAEGYPSVPPPPTPPAGPYGPPGPPGAHPQAYAYGPPGGPYPTTPPPARRSRRGLWIGLGAAGLVLVLMVVGSVYALSSYLDKHSGVTAGPHDLVSQQDIDDLLEGRTRALRDRDEKAFLAPFEPADAALVAQQTSLFRNLVKLPLAQARYQEFISRDFADTGAGVTFRSTVSFVHQFEAFDPEPVEELYEWTVVRAGPDAPLRITKVTGRLAGGERRNATTYHPAPWDLWRDIHVERTPHTVIISDAKLRAEARRLAPVAERAAVEDLAAWRDGGVTAEVPKGFVIALVKGKKQLGTLYRTTKETPTESGVAIPVPPVGAIQGDVADALDVATTRVVIDVGDRYYFGAGDPDQAAVLFRHELAHGIVNVLSELEIGVGGIDGHAKWVVEGFAEYLGHDRRKWTSSSRTEESRSVFRVRGKLEQLPPNVLFAKNGQGSYHYWLAHSAIGYLAEKYGHQKVIRFVAAHYQGAGVDTALREQFGMSYREFEKTWAAYVDDTVR
ncbi:hypothetical protein [Micromonospora endolithica]|uniref:hypothetical protein n=1 Tax=Micromonospora endolithica TaxID=230091 RepID=UPI0011AB968F|nr:hypothetical protein [Micromonospora endolithica]TWJ23211.1 hypothetical protein JD76_03341 [Micromonospora endolithica]